MSDHEFLFALEFSDEKIFDRMLGELARAVLLHVGLAKPAIDELSTALRAALRDGAAAGRRRCDVSFVAHAGALQIVVAFDGGAPWQATWPFA